MTLPMLPAIDALPKTLPIDGAVRIELEEGVPIFRATDMVKSRIQDLLLKRQEVPLSQAEEEELDSYEEIDDYLSFVNRILRNLLTSHTQQAS